MFEEAASFILSIRFLIPFLFEVSQELLEKEVISKFWSWKEEERRWGREGAQTFLRNKQFLSHPLLLINRWERIRRLPWVPCPTPVNQSQPLDEETSSTNTLVPDTCIKGRSLPFYFSHFKKSSWTCLSSHHPSKHLRAVFLP